MRIGIILLLALLVAVPAWPAQQSSATYKAPNGSTIEATAAEIEGIGPRAVKVVLTNQAAIKIINPRSAGSVDAHADRIEMTMYSDAKNAPGGATVKSAHLTGSIKIVQTSRDADGNITTTTATAKDATYDGETQIAVLKGDVKIISTAVAGYQSATMTGDQATVNLKPNLGPDDSVFKITSSPGVSTLELVPSEKTTSGKKQ